MIYFLGYHIKKEYWRNGYAKEAATAVKEWAFANTDFETLYSYMTKDNIGSYKTAESIGMKKIKEYPDEKNYISYASPTQVLVDEWVEMRNGDENGTLYVGHVFTTKVRTGIRESHVVAVSEYDSEAGFEYYWGFGWDKAGIETHEQWNDYLETFAQQVKNPLIVK